MRAHVLPMVLLPCALAACGNVEEPVDVLDCGEVSGLLACNTFEADDPAWTTIENGGVATLDDRDASGGTKALRAQVAVMGGKAVRTRGVESADRYYARFFAKIPAGVDTAGIALLHLGEPVEPYLGTNVEIADGKLGIAVHSAEVYEYPSPMPVDRWTCLELELVVSETGGRVILRADGQTITDRNGIDTRPAGGIGDVEVGLSYVAATGGATALIDDVVIAREPLPACR
jgi:hypothetical protein